MPSGYEKSPDYGGPEPGWPTWLAIVTVVIAAVGAVLAWLFG